MFFWSVRKPARLMLFATHTRRHYGDDEHGWSVWASCPNIEGCCAPSARNWTPSTSLQIFNAVRFCAVKTWCSTEPQAQLRTTISIAHNTHTWRTLWTHSQRVDQGDGHPLKRRALPDLQDAFGIAAISHA